MMFLYLHFHTVHFMKCWIDRFLYKLNSFVIASLGSVWSFYNPCMEYESNLACKSQNNNYLFCLTVQLFYQVN